MTQATPITVVIPTRERCDTLAAALQTCTSQLYDNCRIVVSDNFSRDRTREVVAAARDPRVVYVNPGRRLSMSEHWEFALSHVDGGYVTFLGDDDGLLPGALRRMDELIRTSGAEVVIWDKAQYMWPSQQIEAWRNVVAIPLKNRVGFRDSADVLRRVGAFEAPFQLLPMVYNGVIDMKVMSAIRAATGRFFESRIPDVYSGVAIAANVPRFLHSERPLSVGGASGHSISASLFVGNDEETRRAAEMFVAEENLPFHPALEDAPSLPVYVTESFFQVRDHFPGRLPMEIDLKLFIRRAAQEAASYIPHRYAATVAALREIARKNDLSSYAEEVLAATSNRPHVAETQTYGINPRQHQLVLDGAAFDVNDVAEAARLIHDALVLRERKYESVSGRLKTFAGLTTRRLVRKARRR